MNTYTLSTGRTVEYLDPTADVAAFLDRVRAAAGDPAVGWAEMVSLVHGPDNPIMDRDFMPGRAWVTGKVLDHPLYRVMSDLIFLKQLGARGQTLDDVLSAYTVSVPEAAARLGLTPQAVRAAIDDYRLAAAFRGGQWWIPPSSLESFKVSARGRPRKLAPDAGPVRVRTGGANGASLSVRVTGGELVREGKDSGATAGRFPAGWTRAVVKTTTADGTRAFEIEPAPGEAGAIEHAGMYVRGPFRVAAKHNTTPAANAVWRAAGAARTGSGV